MAKCGHRSKRRRLLGAKRPNGLIARKQPMQIIKMYSNAFNLFRIIHQREPLNDVALNGLRKVMYGIGAVCEPKINNCSCPGVDTRIAPEKIGSMQVVMCPKRLERRQEWRQFLMKRFK